MDSEEELQEEVVDTESSNSDDDWDTDLEETSEAITPNQPAATQVYVEACDHLGTPPVSKFIRQMSGNVVDLKHYGLRDKGVQAVATALATNITVTTLNLYDNGLEETGAKSIAKMLHENCFLTEIDLSGNRIGPAGARAIGDILVQNVTLKTVNLSKNRLTDSDVEFVAEALKDNFHLKSLILSHNNLEDRGGALMGSALAVNSVLESLDVSWNRITSKGAVALLDGARESYTLKFLNVAWNGLSDLGAQALRSTLEGSESITTLNVTNTSITVEGAKQLASGLKRNSTLRKLHVGRNPFLSPGAHVILKAIARNPESALQELHFDEMALDQVCEKKLSEVIGKRPDFLCTWAVSIQGGHEVKKDPDKTYPVEMFMNFARDKKLRMMDLFRRLSKKDTIGKMEFVDGLKNMSIRMNEQQLLKLFTILDENHDGALQFTEFANLVNRKAQERAAKLAKRKAKNSKPFRP